MYTDYSLVAVEFDPFEGDEIEKAIITNEPQREVWLSCMLGGDEASLAYNESVSLELKGDFNYQAFKKALKDLIAHHEGLRSVLSKNGEKLIIYKERSVDIYQEDFSVIELTKKQSIFKESIDREMSKTFDLYNGPLFRVYVHKFSEELHYFTIIIHHLIGDGWSIGVILEDLSLLYNAHLFNKKPNIARAQQISDYAQQQIAFIKSDEYKTTTDFWTNEYKDIVPVLNLPLDFNRPAIRTYRGKRNDYVLDKDLLVDIKQLASQTRSSLVVTLITVFEVLLYHRTGQTDLVVGLPAAGQLATENLRLVGHCVNLLPLLSKINPDQSFISYLNKRRSEIYDAYDHQRLTFSELIRQLKVKRDKSLIPLTPVVFNVDMGMDEKVEFKGLKHHLISNPRISQTFEISLNINGSKDSLIFEWAYNTQLFSSATIETMMQEFEYLLRAFTSDPNIAISNALVNTIPFPELAVHHCSFPQDKTIIDLFTDQVIKRPSSIAAVFEGEEISYKELDKRSNQLANYLISKGVKKDSLVPICLSPSLDMIVGILGILKTGAAYLPIDSEFPSKRISYMVDESESKIIISDQETSTSLGLFTEIEIICINNKDYNIWLASTASPDIDISPKNLIYVIYTSGSTGNPKGVMIEHRSIMDYLFGLQENLPALKQCSSFALGSTIATDLGNTVLFSSLMVGAEMHIFTKNKFNDTEYIHDYFKRYSIDCLKIVPSQWKYLMNDNHSLFPKKLLIFGGESLPGTFIQEIKSTGVQCVLANHYGPTETTIGKLLYTIDKDVDYSSTVPIGKPFSNESIYVLNQNLKPCAIGVPGELYIGGVGMARGYLNNPDLTDQLFTNISFNGEESRLYKTGDLVRWLSDGNIEYLGRTDDQVKIRGNRIELGEIQNVLQTHPDIKQCAVIVEEHATSGRALVAYVVSETDLNKKNVRSFMREQLPDYMIPPTLILLDEIPLTANGKIDRKALPKQDILGDVEESIFVAPENKDQELVANIWAKNLGLKQVSIRDDFFELGGHSMIAIKVMIDIEKTTGKRLPLASLFANPTIEKLAKEINLDQKDKWKSIIPIKETGSKSPLYIVHGQGMHVLAFYTLSNAMDKNQPIYGLQPKGLNPDDSPLENIEQIANGYVKELIEHNPIGPYAIAGYSAGGIIALEMAEQLIEMGKKVSLLALIDTFYDGDSYIKLIKKNKFGEVFKHAINFVAYGFIYMYRYPRAFAQHKINFILGTLYNNYKIINPIKKDLLNPLYILDRLQKAHKKAFKKYKIKNYSSDVILFRGNDKKLTYIPNLESNGFAPYIKGELSFIDIPLEHLRFFDPNYVEIFAKRLQEELDKSIIRKTI